MTKPSPEIKANCEGGDSGDGFRQDKEHTNDDMVKD